MRYKIFQVTCGNVKCYVRAESEESLRALLTQYGIEDFTITRAPGKSRGATSVIECVRDKLRKQ
jgi:hypothetical protein